MWLLMPSLGSVEKRKMVSGVFVFFVVKIFSWREDDKTVGSESKKTISKILCFPLASFAPLR
jgi:hypothetical protein